MQDDASHPTAGDPNARRSFLARVAAVVCGGLVTLFPFAAGWGVATDPLRRGRNRSAGNDESALAGFTPVCPLSALPSDGLPHEFAVTADVTNAWTRAVGQRIGMVFLTRTDKGADPNVIAFTATCPHLGCAVEFDTANDQYECPCHKSGFAIDGKQLFGPSRRGLDSLDVKLVDKAGEKEVWVAFKRFFAGIAERKPIE